MIFLLLWLNPHKIYAYRAQTASADEAVKTCPFALITQEEFELAEVLRASKDVASFSPTRARWTHPPANCLSAWQTPERSKSAARTRR